MNASPQTLCKRSTSLTISSVVAKVLWRDAQGIEGTLDLGAAEVRIGRAMDCAIRTDDAMVSRHHARIYWGGGGYVLEDLNSANHCYYQEQQVAQHMLKHGDAVRCGSLWLRYIDTAQLGQPDAPAPAPQPAPVAAPPPQQQPQQPTNMQMRGQEIGQPVPMPPPAVAPVAAPAPAPAPSKPSESEEEVRRMRRRVEQLQSELRVYRSGKVGAEKARRMEDLEAEVGNLETERDRMRDRVKELEETVSREAGSVKVQKAVEIRGKATEIVTALNDCLSSLRIEVMAAEGEFEQFSHTIPRASFELIRQSMKEAAGAVDQARDLLRQLREVAS